MLSKGGLVVVGLMLGCLGGALGLAVMSVDIGSEWMKIAVVSPGVPMEIALNPESKRKTSVAVSLKDGERKFGSDAKAVGVKSPKHCYTHLLDLLGKSTDNPLVHSYQQRFPYHTIEPTERGTVQFRLDEDTVYSVEEMLGMLFAHAKKQAEDFTEQKIKDAVVTAPIYFNQAERAALISAAKLGGLNVLQLMSEPMAVALNYGMFRRKEVNGTVKNMMLYDMGAQDTTVTVVGYQIVKTKEKGFSETHPQAQILGVGYDRTLGGSEITFRVREYLADEFDAMKKTKTKVRSVPRAMGKLLKEAERVKLVLSANSECFAQIENVMEDIDFRVSMTRDKLHELMADQWERVVKPVKMALDTAAMSMEAIDQVILVGGGSRVPKVQELLTQYVGRELGKNLNTDESAAMGAVYKAADLSSGFKVKKFITKEAVVFPVDVNFERELEGEEGDIKKVRRTLFSRMNPFPQKKIMTFNKHVKDFTFYVNYQDLDYLGPTEISYLGKQNISSVLVKGVAEALDNNKEDNIETKGVKAHFTLDDSGILTCTGVESVFEKTVSIEEQEKLEAAKELEKDDTWSKLGDTISQFFSTDDNEKGKTGQAGGEKDEKKEKKDKSDTSKEKADKKKDAKKEEKKKEEEKKKKEKEPKKPVIETLKEELSMETARFDLPLLEGDGMEASIARLATLDKADMDRIARETALNELESFTFDLQDKISQEEYEKASTDEEREKIRSECSAVSDWLDEEAGPHSELKEFTSRMKQLKDISSSLFARAREHRERPEALEQLQQSIANSKDFLGKSKNLTGDEGFFKEKELEAFEKKVVEVETWRDEKLAAQDEHPLSEMPKLTVSMIGQKIGDLDSEVKFLVQKAKMVKAERERAKRLKEAEEKKAEEAAKKAAKKKKKEEEKAEADGTIEGSGENEETLKKDSTEEKPSPSPTTDNSQSDSDSISEQADGDSEPAAGSSDQPAAADGDDISTSEPSSGTDTSEEEKEGSATHTEL